MTKSPLDDIKASLKAQRDADPTSEPDIIFGTSVAETVQRIMIDAMRINTEQAWLEAAQQICGIHRLVTIMRQPGQPWGLSLTLQLGNSYQTCMLMFESPQRRSSWRDELREKR